MSSLTINQAVQSAENAAADSLNRYMKEMCELVEEKEYFEVQALEKTLDVYVNYTPYSFEPFNRNNRPDNAGCILALKKLKKFEEHQYRIVVKPHATSEMIQSALLRVVLPF